MGRIVVKTSEEIRREWPLERVRAMLDKAPVFHDDITEEDIATGRVRDIPGRGFAAVQRYIAAEERKRKAEEKRRKSQGKNVTVGIRLPEQIVAAMRATDGYSRLLSDYIMSGISSGNLKIPTLRKRAISKSI